jgi:hypothetical protein
MKFRKWMWVIPVCLFAALAMPIGSDAQGAPNHQPTSAPLRLTTWLDMAKAHAAQAAQPQAANPLPKLAGTFITFDIPGATLLLAEGINPRGDIVGGYYDSNFVWQNFVLSNGVVRNINPPGAVPFGWAGAYLATENGINPRGDVVGSYSSGSSGYGEAFGFLLSKGTYTSINPPEAGCFGTIPAGINPQGDIVGFYNDNTANCGSHGFLLSNGVYTNIDVPEALGALPGSTTASAINPKGDILGTYFGSDFAFHGFLLSNGVFSAVPEIPFPLGMNPQGDIVGVNPFGGGFLLSHGTVSTIDVPGSMYTFPYGIDPQGNIVGSYIDSSGNYHGFLLTRN